MARWWAVVCVLLATAVVVCFFYVCCVGKGTCAPIMDDDDDGSCPHVHILKHGMGVSMSTFSYHELLYGPSRFPSTLILDTGEDPRIHPQPKTAPNQPYSIGRSNTRYVYSQPTDENPVGTFLMHTAETISGGAFSIGDGIRAGPDMQRVNANGLDYQRLSRYSRFSENCPLCTSPRRGHSGPLDIVHFWPRRTPYESLLRNASEVFGVSLHEDLNKLPGVLVGDQYGILQSDGSVNRRSMLIKYLELAKRHSNIDILFGATVTKWELERRAGGNVIKRVYFDHNGKSKCARVDQVQNGMGWLRTIEVAKRSGVGPSDELMALGITSTIDIPGLGHFYGDAQTFTMIWADTDPSHADTPWLPCAAFSSSGAYRGQVDAEFPMLVFPRTFTGASTPLIISPLYISSTVFEGYVSLRSASSAEQSNIQIDLGLDSVDSPMLHTVNYLVRKGRELMARNPFFVEVFPGASLPADYTLEQLLAFVKASSATGPQSHNSYSTGKHTDTSGRWFQIDNLQETGSQSDFQHMEGHPLWTNNAISTQRGCDSASRLGGPGCPIA
eukprot:TRINITY_DN10819_c0_g1_i1.p1 TRINITY_DN10819_c0_g1~~TRINITY_DN10819_c0_g1_i1.p1  ORF type:complete len:556 (-),score=8.44 TRINITY_DN10819_c0_g1_i1:196-1863(-)